MNHVRRQVLYVVLGILLIAGGTWWWFANMEQRWTARMQLSDAALQNPMLGAERLLARHQHTVSIAGTLAEALRTPLPGGTLVMLDNGGLVTREQASRLLGWVKRGNTLIVRPKAHPRSSRVSCSDQEADSEPQSKPSGVADTDPIGAEYGIALTAIVRKQQAAPNMPGGSADLAPCLTEITFPGGSYALQLDTSRFALKTSPGNTAPLFGDNNLDAVRIYARGSGHVVFVAQNYFDNHTLPWYDNAELLLGLAELNRKARHVLIVQHLDMPNWYQALWWQFKPAIISIGCAFLLLLWLAVRRFGPPLAGPNQERRSLIEHIDASGRWLWKVPGGRGILLTAVREATEKLLMRKAPELLQLPPHERAAELARLCHLSRTDVAEALLEPASRLPIDFTRQIQTLQQMRKHYER